MSDTSLLTIEYTDHFSEHGCQWTGNIGVIRYFHLMDGNPGSMSFLPLIEKAKAMAKEKHPDAQMLLGIPCYVFRY